MEFLTFLLPYTGAIIRLIVALLLGAVVGIERTLSHSRAGMRTYALVAMGSALFVVTGELLLSTYNASGAGLDPLRIASQIITGIGFLGAGLIIVRGTHVSGLTTAAGLWVAAGIGMAAGFGLFVLALVAALLTLFILSTLRTVEQEVKDKIE